MTDHVPLTDDEKLPEIVLVLVRDGLPRLVRKIDRGDYARCNCQQSCDPLRSFAI